MSTVNEKMTAIADLIRTLIGATGAMGLDAMATNLTTANSAVATAKTAIANKGVSVPEDAGVADLAALIESIICPDVSKVTAAAGDVLAGKVFVNASGNAVTGTMTNQGAVNTTVAAGGTYTIPAGYHNGSGKVTSGASTGYKYTTGGYTPASHTTTSVAITHGLGKTPVAGVLFMRANSFKASTSTLAGTYIVAASNGYMYVSDTGGSMRGGTTSKVSFTSTTATFTGEFATYNYGYIFVG